MFKTFSFLFLLVFLGLTLPAQAQLRTAAPGNHVPTRLYDAGGPGLLFNTLFNPANFRMGHSFEMSVGGGRGSMSSLGMYTNTMAWQFGNKLAARVDMSFAYSPFQDGRAGAFEQNNGQFFLRNAEVAYRPSKNFLLHFQMSQRPYGGGYGGYGYYNPYAYHHTQPSPGLFWKDTPR